jgi:molybdate transport system substrate-binding protein
VKWDRCGLLFAIVAIVIVGCGGSKDATPMLTVSAAASLTDALASCSSSFRLANVRLSFAGSDELAAQIRRGVRPDVFAAANTKLPTELNREGLLEKPVVFATNQLVLAVPSSSDKVRTLAGLAAPGAKLAIGSASVPVGSYTREVLSRLPAGERSAILHNARSEEPDVRGVVGKLTQEAADAGFVFRSDVEAAKGRLDAIELSKRLQPEVAYAAGVLKDAEEATAARSYVNGLVSGPCAKALRRAGFGPPPSS